VTLELIGDDGSSKGPFSGTLSIRLGPLNAAEAAGAVDNTRKEVEASGIGPPSAFSEHMDTSITLAATQGDLASALSAVLSKIDLVVKIGDDLSKVSCSDQSQDLC
jgi:hypothetical protein